MGKGHRHNRIRSAFYTLFFQKVSNVSFFSEQPHVLCICYISFLYAFII